MESMRSMVGMDERTARGERRETTEGIPVAYAQSASLTEGFRKKIPVAMRLGETPVLIPNTMVKT